MLKTSLPFYAKYMHLYSTDVCSSIHLYGEVAYIAVELKAGEGETLVECKCIDRYAQSVWLMNLTHDAEEMYNLHGDLCTILQCHLLESEREAIVMSTLEERVDKCYSCNVFFNKILQYTQ